MIKNLGQTIDELSNQYFQKISKGESKIFELNYSFFEKSKKMSTSSIREIRSIFESLKLIEASQYYKTSPTEIMNLGIDNFEDPYLLNDREYLNYADILTNDDFKHLRIPNLYQTKKV